MKALYYTYPWAFDLPGGGERQLMAYRHHLKEHGVQADLHDPWKAGLQDHDIFHCFTVMPGTLEMCDYAKRQGLALVISPNLWITQATKQNYPMEHIWNMFALADRVIANSDEEGHKFSDVFSMDRSKFYTVHNGVESDFLAGGDASLFTAEFGQRRPFALNVANIEPRKNQLRFIEAMQQYPELDLVIVGHVRDEEYARRCLALGGDRLRVLGPLPYNSAMLRAAYAACAFFAMPSMLETPSIAAIEAAACGARILLTQEGSTHEYFGESVTYVDPLSVPSMIKGIGTALEANPIHSKWQAHHKYLWTKCVPHLVRCYEDVLVQKNERLKR